MSEKWLKPTEHLVCHRPVGGIRIANRWQDVVCIDKRHWEALQAVVGAAKEAFHYQGIKINHPTKDITVFDEERVTFNIQDVRAYMLAIKALEEGTGKGNKDIGLFHDNATEQVIMEEADMSENQSQLYESCSSTELYSKPLQRPIMTTRIEGVVFFIIVAKPLVRQPPESTCR